MILLCSKDPSLCTTITLGAPTRTEGIFQTDAPFSLVFADFFLRSVAAIIAKLTDVAMKPLGGSKPGSIRLSAPGRYG
jgi:hypothetical protein